MATLVIAIVPASAGSLPPYVFFITGNSAVGGFELSVETSDGQFWLGQARIVNGQLLGFSLLCHGIGATFRATFGGTFLTIRGTCDAGSQFTGAVVSGSGIVNGLVVLKLTFSGTPSTSIAFVMRAESNPTWFD